MISKVLSSVLLASKAMASEIPKKSYSAYSIDELNELSFIQRFMISNWTLELFTITFIVLFVVLFKLGDYYNQYITTKFLKSLNEVFTKNFYQYGVSKNSLYVKDNSESYASYATGRVNIAKVNISFKLKPRHNLFVWVLETLLSFFTESVVAPTDRVDFVITPSKDAEYDNFITAIVSKLGMNDYRKFNYYLSLTKTSDSPQLPESFVFMSEANEFQEKVLTEQLKNSLTLQSASYLRYIAFTDQQNEKPEAIQDLVPRRRIIISTKLVSNDEQLKQIGEVLGSVFNVIDNLVSKEITFRNESLRKVVKTRENEVAKLKKIEEAIKQEKLADEKSKLKREERERLRNLSKEEQLKLEKKALEKKQRKQLRKQRVKM